MVLYMALGQCGNCNLHIKSFNNTPVALLLTLDNTIQNA